LIRLNGAETEVPDDLSMSLLLETLDLGGARFAVEVNEEILPRSQFDRYRLAPLDRVEIIQAVGGG
jgi:sulfur carrier protein